MTLESGGRANFSVSLTSQPTANVTLNIHSTNTSEGTVAPASVVLITYATTEDAVRRALAVIEKEGVLAERPQVIRIEKS